MKNIDIETLDAVTKENILVLKKLQETHESIEDEQELEIRVIEKK